VHQARPGISDAAAAQTAASVAGQFQRCFVDRANAVDPAVSPPSCDPPSGTPVVAGIAGSVKSTGQVALGRDFTGSLERALIFEAAVWTLSLLLVLGLPRKVRAKPPQGGIA
jgi:hypothetical protein